VKAAPGVRDEYDPHYFVAFLRDPDGIRLRFLRSQRTNACLFRTCFEGDSRDCDGLGNSACAALAFAATIATRMGGDARHGSGRRCRRRAKFLGRRGPDESIPCNKLRCTARERRFTE
jgi:hypothetical protein